MVIVHEFEKARYTPKQRLRERVKYGTGISRSENGAFYLPEGRYSHDGDGLVPAGDGVGDILNFISNNKELIANVAGAVGAAADAAGKVGSTGVDVVRKIRELRGNGITDEALAEVLAAAAPKGAAAPKASARGGSFFFVKP